MSAVPTMLVRLHPHLKQEESQRLLQNPAFLRNVAMVCRDCYLTITSSLIKLQADRVTKGTRHADFLGISGLRPGLTQLHGKFVSKEKKEKPASSQRFPTAPSANLSRAATKENVVKTKLGVIDQVRYEHEASEESQDAHEPGDRSSSKPEPSVVQPERKLIIPQLILPEARMHTENQVMTPQETNRFRSSRTSYVSSP